MDLNVKSMAEGCIKEIQGKIKNLKKLNIVVAGKTGVGKSTLINYIFRENLAETGIGRPVTQHLQMISKKDFPLTIYDTKGLELGKDTQKEVKREIIDRIERGLKSGDENNFIHCIWYCINTASDRIEEEEIQWIKELTRENSQTRVPIILVLTKAFSTKKAQEFKSYIENLNLNVCAVVPVLALDYEIDEDYVKRAYGGEQLIEVMGQVLGEELLPTLHNVQKAALAAKVKYAQKIVSTTVATTFAEGFTPVPFADATLLVPTQITMIATITAAFGIKVNKAIITGFLTSIIGTGAATLTGRTIVSNLTKLIPGGFIVGGLISGATAATVTAALGNAYIQLLRLMVLGELNTDDMTSKAFQEKMTELFKGEMNKKK